MFPSIAYFWCNWKIEGQQYKQKCSTKSYQAEIKILANPELNKLAFEQPFHECNAKWKTEMHLSKVVLSPR